MSYFAKQADYYARFRPDYSPELFDFVASIAPARRVAWDCATGNGQAALGLAAHFDRVIATDASSQQISRAVPHARIEYRVAPAESSGLADRSIDAITVCQALHWLDLPKFFAEAKRVLVPHGVLVATVYSDPELEDVALNPILQHYNKAVVGKYWPAERKIVDEQYRSIRFPFEELPTPQLVMEREWNMEQLIGYLRSWSATVGYIEANGVDPTEEFRGKLARLWGDPAQSKRIIWPFTIRACQFR
ncbi:MAG: class I SAM-dependent methyltransferase [Acidobacteriales bacterium]|nr:class I SAM-dependent methyltransferase [Terriglobales bacterium]